VIFEHLQLSRCTRKRDRVDS